MDPYIPDLGGISLRSNFIHEKKIPSFLGLRIGLIDT
jgi:hypothetical protein